MAAHARLKNDFTDEGKYHNLMTWLKSPFYIVEERAVRCDWASVKDPVISLLSKSLARRNSPQVVNMQ